MSTDFVDLLDLDEPEYWTCRCGRRNIAGLSMCPACGTPPPRGRATRRAMVEAQGLKQAAPVRVKGTKLAVGVILANVVVQAVTMGMVQAGQMTSSRAITVSLWMGLAFYAVVLVALYGPLLALRPQWTGGDPRTAGLFGAEVGFATAAVLGAIAWAVSGHPVLDPAVRLVVADGSVLRILLAFGAFVVAAPVVEELLFRGVVAESLRHRGLRRAVYVSAFLFALAHLGNLLYYTGMGALLGRLYLRRGLKASIAAHAAFNGSLVVLAIVVALGPAHDISRHGVSVRASAAWQEADAKQLPLGVELALEGPGGANIAIGRYPIPSPALATPEQIAGALNFGDMPMPEGVSVVRGTARVVDHPAGRGVRAAVTVFGRGGDLLLVPRGEELWSVDVFTADNPRAIREYPEILRSLTLPPQV